MNAQQADVAAANGKLTTVLAELVAASGKSTAQLAENAASDFSQQCHAEPAARGSTRTTRCRSTS